jgi:hypothetical protein
MMPESIELAISREGSVIDDRPFQGAIEATQDQPDVGRSLAHHAHDALTAFAFERNPAHPAVLEDRIQEGLRILIGPEIGDRDANRQAAAAGA